MPEGATLAKSKVASWGAARLPNSFSMTGTFAQRPLGLSRGLHGFCRLRLSPRWQRRTAKTLRGSPGGRTRTMVATLAVVAPAPAALLVFISILIVVPILRQPHDQRAERCCLSRGCVLWCGEQWASDQGQGPDQEHSFQWLHSYPPLAEP